MPPAPVAAASRPGPPAVAIIGRPISFAATVVHEPKTQIENSCCRRRSRCSRRSRLLVVVACARTVCVVVALSPSPNCPVRIRSPSKTPSCRRSFRSIPDIHSLLMKVSILTNGYPGCSLPYIAILQIPPSRYNARPVPHPYNAAGGCGLADRAAAARSRNRPAANRFVAADHWQKLLLNGASQCPAHAAERPVASRPSPWWN